MTATNSARRIFRSDFKPARWLKHRHLQTILPSLPWAYPHACQFQRVPLELPDGDVTAVDWAADSSDLPLDSPLLVILHGLESSSESSYARMLMHAANQRGWRCCVLHFRDCGNYRNRLPRRYHAGETNDLRHFLKSVIRDGQTGPIFAAGYSLGGNVLLKYLGETGPNPLLQGAVAVCVPLNLHTCAEALNKGFSKVYQRYLLTNMKESMGRKFDRDTAAFDWERAVRAKTFAEFDDAVTAPLHGFEGMKDYYDRCSSISYLGDIDVPTLIINALDDPFMTPEVIPDENSLSEKVRLEVSESGGHVGFIEGGTPWRPKFYLPRRLIGFLEDQLRSPAPDT